jgi:hypothetical protein
MTEPDLTMLALGTDLTGLGLNLNSPDPLYKVRMGGGLLVVGGDVTRRLSCSERKLLWRNTIMMDMNIWMDVWALW